MAAFYLDNDVPTALARELRGQAHRAATTRGRGLGRAGDDEQLVVAAQHNEIFVTCNRSDFFLLHDAWLRWAGIWALSPVPEHSGILVIPQDWPPDLAAHEIDLFVTRRGSFPNQCYRYRMGQGWEARL